MYRGRRSRVNATFNNISVTSWHSVLLVEETGVPGENHRALKSENKDWWKKNAHFFFSVYLLDVNGNFTDEFKYLQKNPVDFES
jgi:hypothetical protein